MEILEFGNKDKRKIILIHGFQMPYQIWNKYIEYYKNNFHIIVLILPGHYPNHKDVFISFYMIAKELEYYYISLYGNDVCLIYGMSMGGVLATILWQRNRLKIDNLIIDSTPLVSINPFIEKVMLNYYLNVTNKTKQRDKKTLMEIEKIFPLEYINYFLLVLDNMSDVTIKNCVKEVVKFRFKYNLDIKDTKVYYFYGTKINEYYAKKTAKVLSKNYSNTFIKCFKGKGHCENLLFYPELIIKEMDDILM